MCLECLEGLGGLGFRVQDLEALGGPPPPVISDFQGE